MCSDPKYLITGSVFPGRLSQEVRQDLPPEAGLVWVGEHWRTLLVGGALQEGGQLPPEAGDQTLDSIQGPERRGVRSPHPVSTLSLYPSTTRLTLFIYLFISNLKHCRLSQGGGRLAESEERFPAEAHEADRGGEAGPQNKRGKESDTVKRKKEKKEKKTRFVLDFKKSTAEKKGLTDFPLWLQVLVDFVSRIGKTNVSGKIEDLYFELNKWSFESEFDFYFILAACGVCWYYELMNWLFSLSLV